MTPYIPLYRPDLDSADELALLAQLRQARFRDPLLVRCWEGQWERLWERRAVAFAGHGEAVRLLKALFGWSSGTVVSIDPLLDPAWQEALQDAWLTCPVRDLDEVSLSGVGVWIHQHPFGSPVVPSFDGLVLEEISAVPLPLPLVGSGAVQLVNLTGPRILPVGVGCVLLSTDDRLIDRLLEARQEPPGAAACVLGMSLLAALPDRLQRRCELAERYGALRMRGMAVMPHNPATGRFWELFYLQFRDLSARQELEAFLTKAGIGCGALNWFAVPDPPSGYRTFLSHALALPLYAALTDAECKRIINRVHRWVERQ